MTEDRTNGCLIFIAERNETQWGLSVIKQVTTMTEDSTNGCLIFIVERNEHSEAYQSLSKLQQWPKTVRMAA